MELTLSARKKISSILKHLNNKWESSSAAMGELMLFPYNMRSESFSASRRWTSDNAGITAGELYEILDSPPVFRLRYMDVLFFLLFASSLLNQFLTSAFLLGMAGSLIFILRTLEYFVHPWVVIQNLAILKRLATHFKVSQGV